MVVGRSQGDTLIFINLRQLLKDEFCRNSHHIPNAINIVEKDSAMAWNSIVI
jgi:hypothetical protein